MLYAIMRYYGDLALFATIVLAATVGVEWWLRRSVCRRGLGYKGWAAMLATVATGCGLAVVAGDGERGRLHDTLAGVAPTYAMELSRQGIERITPQTAADDPGYLALIDTEKRWLACNPSVADIYTFARPGGAGGPTVVLVDSETDYDRDGVYSGDRETRTAIGEPYAEDVDLLDRAFSGEPVFTGRPTTDRWGTWVSTYVPIWGDRGRVIGVLGVDYPATDWVRSILWQRFAALGFATAVSAVLLGSMAMQLTNKANLAIRVVTETALRASETRLRAIIDNEPECVMVTDPAGRLVEINPAGRTLMGLTPDDAPALAVESLLLEDDRASWRRHLTGVLGGESRRMEVGAARGTASGEDGVGVWMDAHSVPVRDPDGRVSSVLTVARDVSARRRSEREREQLQMMLVDASRRAGMAEIATGVLHNVGNVLNSVNVSARIATERLAGASAGAKLARTAEMLDANRNDLATFLTSDEMGRKLPEYLTLLGECIDEELRGVTGELADLSRGVEHLMQIVRSQQQTARGVAVMAEARPADIAAEAVRLNFNSLDRHHIEVITHYADLPEQPLDRHRITQVLVNLIANAKEAVMPLPEPRRRITIRVHGDGAWTEFAVSDLGVGIAPDVMEKMFRHGFTTRPQGHGFGLHSSANAAAEMGGTLTAASDGVGRGATFTLRVPSGAAASSTGTAPREAA